MLHVICACSNIIIAFALMLPILSVNGNFGEQFDEELLVKDLGGGFTGFHLNFVARAPEFERKIFHHNIIPKSIFNLISKYSVNELHLSMVRGFWDYEQWGKSFVTVAPTGAELWSWFKENTSNVDQAWFELTHALSGQFCASLNRLAGRTHSVIPKWSYRPTGITKPSDDLKTSRTLRYAQMPGEGLCSENFTPWVKLLPCKNLKGLSSLLVPTSLFRSNYLALTLHLRPVCWDHPCTYIGFEFTQTLTAVFDRSLIYGYADHSWSVSGLLGSPFQGTCAVARSSRVFLLASASPVNASYVSLKEDVQVGDAIVQAVHASDLFFNSNDYKFPSSSIRPEALPEHAVLSVTRYATGSGTAGGGVRTVLTSHVNFGISVVYLDAIPWYTQVTFSTLKIYSRQNHFTNWIESKPLHMHLVPSLARERMGMMEMVISVPAGHEVAISYEYRRVLQRWDEYPPDANRGYFLPSASVSYQIPKSHLLSIASREITLPNWAGTYAEYFNHSSRSWFPGDGFVRVHSPVLVITMPTPDFSMPFNALCIVCSVIALLFGSVHKVTAGSLRARVSTDGLLKRLLKNIRLFKGRMKDTEKPKTE